MLNKVILQGRLAKDVELRYTNNQKAVTSFTVAVQDDNDRDKTDFIDCVAWGATAEFLSKYFGKGSMILITGRLTKRDYKTNNGETRYVTEVVLDQYNSVHFCESKSKDNSAPKQEDKPIDYDKYAMQEVDELDDGDLPF